MGDFKIKSHIREGKKAKFFSKIHYIYSRHCSKKFVFVKIHKMKFVSFTEAKNFLKFTYQKITFYIHAFKTAPTFCLKYHIRNITIQYSVKMSMFKYHDYIISVIIFVYNNINIHGIVQHKHTIPCYGYVLLFYFIVDK